jgi:hypothetical protein
MRAGKDARRKTLGRGERAVLVVLMRMAAILAGRRLQKALRKR